MSAAALAAALSTATVFSTPGYSGPADVLWDARARLFYASDVAGKRGVKDGQGWLSLAGPDGRLLAPRWVEGLNAPEGLALSRGVLYAADVDMLVAVEPSSGRVLRRLPVPGAVDLAGLCAAGDGTLYAADPAGGAIFRVGRDGKVSEWARGAWLESPAGLALRGRRLYVAARGTPRVPGRLYWLELKTKRRHDVSPVPLGPLEGLAYDAGAWLDPATWRGSWLVTDASGKVWRVKASDGEPTLLIDGLRGPGGPVYDRKRGWVVVPRFDDDLVSGWDTRKAAAAPGP